MILSNVPALGNFIGHAFSPIKTDSISLFDFRRAGTHTPFAKLVSTDSAYSQSFEISQRIDGKKAGTIFFLGGDGPIGHTPTAWFTADDRLAPITYDVTASSWFFGDSKTSGTFLISGRLHENGVFFRFDIDDAGLWAPSHSKKKDGDYNDLVVNFAIITPGISDWRFRVEGNHTLVAE
jgi:hypothetical protein